MREKLFGALNVGFEPSEQLKRFFPMNTDIPTHVFQQGLIQA